MLILIITTPWVGLSCTSLVRGELLDQRQELARSAHGGRGVDDGDPGDPLADDVWMVDRQ
ncbi:hypothetical protein [Blastococcus sp. SYSU DS0539]